MADHNSFPLIVPIHLDAVCVGLPDSSLSEQEDTRMLFAGQEFDFSKLPSSGRSDALFLPGTVETELFEGEARPPGIYLHWELPPALRHGNTAFQITPEVINRLKHLGFPSDLTSQLSLVNAVFSTREAFETKLSSLLDTWLQTQPGSDAVRAAKKAWFAYYVVQSSGRILFPKAPNRWLVIRQNQGQAGGSALPDKYWLIESDYLSTTPLPKQDGNFFAESVAIPSPYPPDKDPQQTPYRYAGRIRELSEVSGAGEEFESWTSLDATGFGLPSFSGLLPNCPNVLGHKDPLADLIDGQRADLQPTYGLSYVVIGWHHEAADDPLQGGDPGANASRLKWTFPGLSEKEGPALQQTLSQLNGRTIYCGLLQKVQWNRGHAYKSSSPPENSSTLIVASTPAEALATYLASEEPPEEQDPLKPEEKLEALQMGILREIECSPEPELAIENALHEGDFSSEPGGFLWQISPIKDQNAGDAAKDPFYHRPNDVSLEIFPDLGESLNQLNIKQETFNQLVRLGDAQRWQLYAYWVNYLQLESQGNDEFQGLETYLDNLCRPDPDPQYNLKLQNFPALEKELQDTSKGIMAQLGDLLQKLNTYKVGETLLSSKYQLEFVPAPRFWQGNDPVLMLVDEDTPASSRLDAASQAGDELVCRLSSQLLSGPAATKDSFSSSAGATEKSYLDGEIAGLSALIDQILAEANYLQDVNQDGLKSGQPTAGPVSGFYPEPKSRTIWGLPASASAGGVNRTNPWHPVLLRWSINLHYPQRTPGQYPADYMKQLAALSPNHLNLQYQVGALDTLVKAQRTYNGSIVISRQAYSSLKAQTDRYFDFSGTEDAQLKKWSQQIQDKRVFSQALNGWNDILLMRRRSIQVPVFDPQEDISAPDRLSKQVQVNVGQHNYATPQADYWFSPISCGFLEVEKIRLIDAFGQIRDVNPQKIMQPSRMKPECQAASGGAAQASPSWFLLPPRITQPSRLLFRWISAEPGKSQSKGLVEMNSHPATSPICGWVVSNHMDNSLMIFEPDGKLVGALGQEHPVSDNWTPAPGITPALQIQDIRNKQLRDFASAYNRKTPTELANFRTQIDQVLQSIEPQNHHDNALTVLMGRPLALVQASLKLELHGLPACSQDQGSYQGFFGGEATGLDNQKYNEVLFPVRLGDLSSLQDGLVGYFKLDQNQNADFSEFYTENMDQFIWLTPSDSLIDHTQCFLLLIDPRAKVHATSGVLPVKSISIPAGQYIKALQSIEYTFTVGPVLSALNPFQIPVPAETTHHWAWLSRQSGSSGWAPQQSIRPPSGQAGFSAELPDAREGWLKVKPFSNSKKEEN